MNTLGLVAVGVVAIAFVAVRHGVRATRKEVHELKVSLAYIMREVDSHEWHVKYCEPPGRWRDDMLLRLAQVRHSLNVAKEQSPRVHLSSKARKKALRFQVHAEKELRQYYAQRKSAKEWAMYLRYKPINDLPRA